MNGNVLVIGGGIAGVTAALEAAEAGKSVHLVEKEPFLGGRVIRMNKYFPKLCPPACGMEIQFRRLRANPNVTVHTLTEVGAVTGGKGAHEATITRKPRYVNARCVACGECEKVCPVTRASDFDYGLRETKAIYLPHSMAHPQWYVIDMSVCKGATCGECVKACKYGAIELDMKETTETVTAGAVIHATGWRPYDARKIANLGYGQVKNVINNVEMERIASASGPTGGKILRRDNGQPVKTVAFVQCAGSRDENHLPYCSSICCLASLKQAMYVREQYPESEVYIFYIDLRAPGKYEKFYQKIQSDPGVKLIKGKVAKIEQDATGAAVVTAEDIFGGSTGMEPSVKGAAPLAALDDNGFTAGDGALAAGVAAGPFDVTTSIQSATGAAMRALIACAGR
ncbi:MAG: CoB--CoM heterodisulfide reductase iron-sulfur subunit A family protein [Nitrospinae bacterium]|nr:CoB--CoM heterodisulfide reductase iron-sulfur subunit A family protein [Nitrospinota bacterium]